MLHTVWRGIIAYAIVGYSCAAWACPSRDLLDVGMQALEPLAKEERPADVWLSTEGGHWEIFRHPDGTLHSVVRRDFGETGQASARLSFLSPQEFVISKTIMRYAPPYDAREIVGETTLYYFFCSDVVNAPIVGDDNDNAVEALSEATRLRLLFFDSAEISEEIGSMR